MGAVQQTIKAKQSVLADVERLSVSAESIDLSGWSLDDPIHHTNFTSWLQSEAVATIIIVDKAELPVKDLQGVNQVTSIDLSGSKVQARGALVVAACIKGNVHLQS